MSVQGVQIIPKHDWGGPYRSVRCGGCTVTVREGRVEVTTPLLTLGGIPDLIECLHTAIDLLVEDS